MCVILSFSGMPRVRSPVCMLVMGLPPFAGPNYISRLHVCPKFIDLFGQLFFIYPEVHSAYVGHCFATDHCVMIHFLVPFVTGVRWCRLAFDNSSFARDLEGGKNFLPPGVSRCLCTTCGGTSVCSKYNIQFHISDGPPTTHVQAFTIFVLCSQCVCALHSATGMYAAAMPCLSLVLWWSLAYVGSEIFLGGGGWTLRRLWYAVPHWWSSVFIIIVIHVCFLLFLLS